MQVHCEEQPPDGLRIALSGAVTLQAASALRDLLAERLAAADRVIVDLAAVEDVDATAIQLLIGALRKARDQGKRFELAATPAPALHRLCTRLGFIDPAAPGVGGPDADLFRALGA